MSSIPYVFTILKYSGMWRPIEWSSGWRRNIYGLYTTVVIVALYTFSLSEALYAFKYIDDVEEIAYSTFMFLTLACAVTKAMSILNKRRDITGFEDIFKNDNCKPNGPDEINIVNKCDTEIRRTTLWYVTLLGSTVAAGWTGSLFTDVPQRKLNFNAWVPFNYTTPILFWSAYIHQIFSHSIAVAVASAYDVLLLGLIFQACTQLKVLKFRLEFMPRIIVDELDDKKKLHHERNAQQTENRVLASFTETVNSTFSFILFLQCAVSTFVLCFNIYVLSKMKPFTTEFTSTVLYTCCMLAQIFVYCWFGNQIIIESMDVRNAVYAMDWSKLSVKTQKNLVVVMISSIHPMKFTTANIIILCFDTFISLLKLSYSSFNLLQQTS